jgi:hypothetical protein
MKDLAFDSVPMEQVLSPEGYLFDNPIVTGAGIFEYENSPFRRQLRLPEDVFSEESLASYEGKPIILTHRAGEVTKDNVKGEIIGTILSKGVRDGDNVRVQIVIHDTDMLKNSGLRELSLGYERNFDETPGEWGGKHYDAIQKDIRINHLALVGNARAKASEGIPARLNIDGADTPKNKNSQKGAKTMSGKESKDKLNKDCSGSEGETPDINTDNVPPKGQTGDQIIAEQAQKIEELQKVIEELRAKMDFAAAKPPINQDQAEIPPTMNADSVDNIVKERVKLARIADKLNLDGIDEMSPLEAKKAIIKKVNPGLNLDGKSADYVNVCFDMTQKEISTRKSTDDQRQQMSKHNFDGITQNGKISAETAREKMIEKMMYGGEE